MVHRVEIFRGEIFRGNKGVVVLQVCKISYLSVFPSRVSRLTVVSREAKKKQHVCASSGPCDHYSELFTRMAALKF